VQGKQTFHNKAGQGFISNMYIFKYCCRCSLFTGNHNLKPEFTADTSLSHADK